MKSKICMILLPFIACAAGFANSLPTLTLSCDPCTVAPGGTVRITAEASDPDGDQIHYIWDQHDYFQAANSTSGSAGPPVVVDWIAPSQIGAYEVGLCVYDHVSPGFTSRRLTINVALGAPRGPTGRDPASVQHRPFPPRGLTAVGGDGEVVLSWRAASTGGGAEISHYEYRVDRRHPWISTGSFSAIALETTPGGRSVSVEWWPIDISHSIE